MYVVAPVRTATPPIKSARRDKVVEKSKGDRQACDRFRMNQGRQGCMYAGWRGGYVSGGGPLDVRFAHSCWFLHLWRARHTASFWPEGLTIDTDRDHRNVPRGRATDRGAARNERGERRG